MPENVVELKDVDALQKFVSDANDRLQKCDARIAQLESQESGEKIKELNKLLVEQRSILDEMARKRIPLVDTETKQIISPKEMRQFGVKALLDAPTPIEKARSATANHGFSLGIEPAKDVLGRFQEAEANMYLMSKLLGGSPERDRRVDVKTLDYFKDTYMPAREAARALYKEAFDTADTGAGLEWIGVAYGNRLFELVRLDDNILNFFGSFNMPRQVFTAPVQLGDLSAFGYAENTSHTGQTAISEGVSTNTITGSTTWTAHGVGTRAFTSKFMEEDSLIPFLPWLQDAVVQAIRNGLKNAIINGDTTATHQDNDIAGVTLHAAKRFIGLRKAARTAGSEKDAGGVKINSDANFFDYVGGGREGMGKYGVNPGQLGLFTGPIGFNQLLRVPMFATAANLAAMQGTNVQGQFLFRPFGMTLDVSETVKENLANTGVNTAGGPNNLTCMVLANQRAWLMGNLRNITVQMLRETYAEYDQDVALVTWRGDFQKIYGSSAKTEATVYNIATT